MYDGCGFVFFVGDCLSDFFIIMFNEGYIFLIVVFLFYNIVVVDEFLVFKVSIFD